MATYTPSQILALDQAIIAAIQTGWQDLGNSWAEQFGFLQDITVSNETFTYPWIQDFSQIQEKNSYYDVLGTRIPQSNYLTASIKHYGDRVSLPSLEVNLEQSLDWISKAADIGRQMRQLPTKLTRDFIGGATANFTLYDGAYYYANSHSRGGTTYDNLLSGDLSATTLTASKVAMSRFPDDTSMEMGVMPNCILIAPDNEYTARQLIRSTTVTSASGDLNPLQGIVENIIVESRANSTLFSADYDDVYFFATQYQQKPFFRFNLSGYSDISITNNLDKISDPDWNKMYIWQVEQSLRIYPTYPFLSVKLVGA